jgi:hypothetical protein
MEQAHGVGTAADAAFNFSSNQKKKQVQITTISFRL